MGKRHPPIALSKERKPYEQQPEESSKAFYAFSLFRDLGVGRRVTDMAGEYNAKFRNKASLSSSVDNLSRWSTRYRWVERSNAWDSLLDSKLRQAQVTEIQKMRRRHLDIGKAMQALAAKALRRCDQLTNSDPNAKINVKDFVSLFKEGIIIERQCMNEPDSRTETTITIDPENEREFLRDTLKNPALVDAVGAALRNAANKTQ